MGQFGRFAPHRVTPYYSQPLSFALPKPGPGGEIDLAVRFYMTAATRFANPDVGGMHTPPVLGLESTVQLLQAADNDANLHREFSIVLRTLFFLLAAPLALWAWMENKKERSWLWLFLALVSAIVTAMISLVASLTTALTIADDVFFDLIIVGSLVLPLWITFWWEWFGLHRRRWIPIAAWLLTAAEILAEFGLNLPYLNLSFLPLTSLHWFNTISLWCVGALGVLLAVILVEGFRHDRTGALLAALPILLLEFTQFSPYLLATFDVPAAFFLFGLGVALSSLAVILMIVVVGALALRRFVRTQVRESLARQAVKKDLEQAQQLQQRVLVPEDIASPHFKVESAYRPAQTVGGDFFQTLTRPDGTLLVVIGDVSGKGVGAAMLVAVLVGAIRNQVESSFDPAGMLATLNRRLIGRAGGHLATCLAAEIGPDGAMRIANAGHLSPYLNGKELELEGSLPLGVTAEAAYPSQNFILRPGDRLTFMTDGVVEATNLTKELFGFERARTISREHPAAIAQQAQAFGQEDDITVLGIEFAGAAAAALP